MAVPKHRKMSLEKEIEYFENWIWEEKTMHKIQGKKPSHMTVFELCIHKELIISLAEKGLTRHLVWEGLYAQKKLTASYQTFLEHLKRQDLDKYFVHRKKKRTNK